MEAVSQGGGEGGGGLGGGGEGDACGGALVQQLEQSQLGISASTSQLTRTGTSSDFRRRW